ncbi:uncharacterized protein AMSG_11648 [Thecamonas trahens ATCC 50062]|uniref:Uncharacterized protein n=1 Tax=Thecamonas trahens ATCC 50062 TaxID=461836 RepID=A0A0L0DMW3_THETB|nr:hypothetical protein AMSG_11648 [Thecamonas trahens ATCC 50062]KNC53647.1 hypothetical protein AMSG_11648 [Thecamonas trahens ATCC 50062]|eukprot:XP_013762047.1 hypothetical protein AMSG_11648 [Thecamonas trahens ATCC 50062]
MDDSLFAELRSGNTTLRTGRQHIRLQLPELLRAAAAAVECNADVGGPQLAVSVPIGASVGEALAAAAAELTSTDGSIAAAGEIKLELPSPIHVGKVVGDGDGWGAAVGRGPASAEPGGMEAWLHARTVQHSLARAADDLPSGAIVSMVVPPRWAARGRKLLLLAHGFRKVGTVRSAELDVDDPFVAGQLQRGMAVAITSYRREGRIVRDAVKDMIDLRQWAANHLPQPPVRVVVEGRSMGGAVVVHLAESAAAAEFDGIVAIGAALLVCEDDDEGYAFSHAPRLPIVFLANESEVSVVDSYVERVVAVANAEAADRVDSGIVVPAVWQVPRDGHNLVAWLERSTAHDKLATWVDHASLVTLRRRHILMEPPLVGETAVPVGRTKIRAVVGAVHPVHRSFVLDVTRARLGDLGHRPGKAFSLATAGESALVRVFYSTYPFGDVPADAFMAYNHPDGHIVVTQKGWYKVHTPADTLGLVPGAIVTIGPALPASATDTLPNPPAAASGASSSA